MKKILLGDEFLMVFAQIGELPVVIDIQGVVSVIEPQKTRNVPAVPEYINSILNHHGDIVALLDLNAYFKGKETVAAADRKVIYLKHKEIHLGLYVDRIFKIDYIAPSYLKGIPEGESENIKSEFCKGVFALGKDEIYFLDTKRILEFAENLDMRF